jgi:DNA repair exonuclease SbcCD ATPase subunit
MAVFNFLKNFGKVKAEQAEDSLINLAVSLDRDGVAEAAIKQKQDEHEQRIIMLQEANSSYLKEQKEYEQELDLYTRYMNQAEHIQTLLEDPTATNKDELTSDLTKLLDAIEKRAPILEKEKTEAEEAKQWMLEMQEAADEISKELLSLRETVTQAKADIQRAEVDKERQRKKAEQAEIIAGLRKSGNKFDTAINALKNKAEAEKKEAEVFKLKTESLKKPVTEDVSSILNKYDIPKSTSTESLTDRLARLKQ